MGVFCRTKEPMMSRRHAELRRSAGPLPSYLFVMTGRVHLDAGKEEA
jgi:hypothetical protein